MEKLLIFLILLLTNATMHSQSEPSKSEPSKSEPSKSEPSESTSVLEFVGNANIQKSFSSGENIPANTGIGVIYRENLHEDYTYLHNIELTLNINVASTADTLKTQYKDGAITNRSEFGNSILLPSNSGQAFDFCFIGYLTKPDKTKLSNEDKWYRYKSPMPLLGFISGFKISLQGSNRNWFDTETTTSIKASNLSCYIGIFHEFIKRVLR